MTANTILLLLAGLALGGVLGRAIATLVARAWVRRVLLDCDYQTRREWLAAARSIFKPAAQ